MENISPMNSEQEPTNPLNQIDYHYRMVDDLSHRFATVVYQELWYRERQHLPHYKAYQSIWVELEKQISALQEIETIGLKN
jgi:hypothetical protein